MSLNNTLPFAEFPMLETRRLKLREPDLSDAEDMLVFRGDPYVQRFNSEPMTDVSQAKELITGYHAAYLKATGILWGITLKGRDTVIGTVSLGIRYWISHHRADLGYDLAHAYWGQGIGREAVQEVVRFGFERMGLNRIEAETIEDNDESRKLLDKLGFVCEGIRRGYSLEDDAKYHGSAIYGLLKSEYKPRE